jgi:hypothetical protein
VESDAYLPGVWVAKDGIVTAPNPHSETAARMEVADCWYLDLSRGQIDGNARRIVACVNACRALPTERLEGLNDGGQEVALIFEQRDNALAALRVLLDLANRFYWETMPEAEEAWKKAQELVKGT